MTNNCNVNNRTIFCDDNLDVMQGINSECIDLIYLDPPFNKNKRFTAPIGSSAEGASFKDIFRREDVKDEWLQTIEEDLPDLYHYLSGIKGVGKDYNFAYLAYMAIRLIECHRVLKSTGSIYLHCDPTMSHYLKTTMDCIFGEDNFRNEVIWHYTGGGRSKAYFSKKHDTLLMYNKARNYTFNIDAIRVPYKETSGYAKGGITSKSGKHYMPHPKGTPVDDVWDIPIINPMSYEREGYPTQKPLVLLDRVIKASSNEDDIVLDPFCGCATTCVAAERLGRRWIGIDISHKAYELVKKRLLKEAADPGDIFKYENEIYMYTDPPNRTDQGIEHREKKWVYVISHPNYSGEYKVGIAKNWKSRLNSYQTSDPDRQYKVEFKLETPLFREIEKHIHNTFTNKYEWVQGDLKTIKQAIKDYHKSKV